MASMATSPAFSISEGMSRILVAARNCRASGELGMIRRFFRPLRSMPNCGRKLALLAPSTSKSGMSGRRRERTSAIRAKTCAPLRGSELTKVTYCGGPPNVSGTLRVPLADGTRKCAGYIYSRRIDRPAAALGWPDRSSASGTDAHTRYGQSHNRPAGTASRRNKQRRPLKTRRGCLAASPAAAFLATPDHSRRSIPRRDGSSSGRYCRPSRRRQPPPHRATPPHVENVLKSVSGTLPCTAKIIRAR